MTKCLASFSITINIEKRLTRPNIKVLFFFVIIAYFIDKFYIVVLIASSLASCSARMALYLRLRAFLNELL